MKDLYSLLATKFEGKKYAVVTDGVKFDQLSHFISMKGKHYDDPEQNCRLFLIGRAVNGWGKLNASDAKAFGDEAQNELDKEGFQWVINDEDGRLHNDETKLLDGEKIYYLSKSPFWRTAKQIWEGLAGKEQERWVDYIAWSNLYKIAPPVTGNPTNEMCEHQIEVCREILLKEIELYKPTHILFVTGWDWWFHDKSGRVGFSDKFPDVTFIDRNKKSNGVYVEGCGTYQNIKVVVACRPEQRKEDDYVKQVLEFFK